MEVWDSKLFETICPGKAKSVGRERWIESLLKAVEIFGWGGKVHTNFVVGVEMVPPFGFKTEEEAAESVAEGLQYMACHGVSLRNQLFRGRPGAALSQAPRPRIEYYLRMEQERFKLQREYNLKDPYPY